jgi:hypothetical protein
MVGSVVTGYCKHVDLDTWLLRHDRGAGFLGDSVFGKNVFVAIGHDPAGTILRSDDGETWEQAASGSTALLSGAA